MIKRKNNSKAENKKIEFVIEQIKKLENVYGQSIVYFAARRYNDRIYSSKCRKNQK